MRGVTEWLESIGLSEYAQRFAENGIDLSVVRDLTDQDLKELGVVLGHRRKLLRAIAELDDAARAEPAKTATEPRRSDEGERRHLTVMFCDLVGSTALSARLDPEDMRTLIGAYHTCITEVISRYQGKIARYMGDGVLVYFGYPQAHEDDAEQAVHAALALIRAIASIRNVAAALQIRVGIATGTVVVTELLIENIPAEQAVVGETPNLAARLQTMAEPETVLICASTRRLTGGEFHYRDLGPVALKGWAEPVRVYQVLEMSGVESHFEAMHTTKLPPLFGRDEEIELLLRRWRQATQEEGRVVTLTGEPGIGKSHIASALNERLQTESHITLRYFCSEHHTHSALFPFISQLERAAGFKHSDSPHEKLCKLDALLAQSTHDPEHLAVLANLLALPTDDHYRLLDVTPQKRKEKTFAALLAQLVGLVAQQPALLIFEDVHWIDPTSLELLAATVEHVPQLRALVLITARPQFTLPWPSYPHTTTIPLTRLGRRDGAALVLRLTGGRTLPKEVMERILAHTDGVPLFVEELTKMVLEGGLLRERDGEYILEGPLPSLAIPTTLQASLMARLDRLSPVRDVAQIGAVAGREFHYELVSAVAGLPTQRLDEALDQLVRSELIFCRGEIPHAVYTFKHALVRDAAYEGLLKSRRVHLHAAIAKALEQQFPEIVQAQPETIAYHYTQARNYEKAVHYWYEAGKRSAARSAHNEAVGHLKQGLNQIPNIDDPMLRAKSELLLQTSLGNSLRAIKGWSTDSVKHAYTRALQLCKESGLDELILPAVFGLWTWNFVHASLGEAQALAEHLLNSAEDVDNSVCKVLAHEALGFTLFAQGKFADAHAELERSINLCDDSKASAYLDLSAQDPRVHVRLYDGMALCLLGYPDRALRICTEARRYADASQHPFSEAIARTISLRVHQLRGDVAAVADQANAVIAFCEEHEFVHYLAMALILRGWANAHQGEFEKGIAEVHEGLEQERATGALIFESYVLGLLADACIKNKRYGQALGFLKQAQLRLNEENSERFYAAEIYRLLGETCLRSNQDLDQAEHYFCEGLEVAREQNAKLFQLRLCLSKCDLYELRQGDNRCRLQLGEVYASFSEGFDTADLVRAQARLKSA
ncbi:adenylate/guanylate cyclase domain-containing protein [Bradyrhizobium sp. AUGA SZCCT0283]|uniref:adenylate/guanylate cyclase domain-containing protein n=1 Tax=Bradyrhizobium sp. AUGA SZCCT0283 TaxID=2807671 RepID=UPI001BAD5712|nr:adenylate/guanylate cyclase domain-containing protein [Bradyrhizobium sp. AUGA SZCCT0283]MBR1280397.1 AAA family ATPase [Bradyrhizobium sp. AUGA SZCCT0283]